MRVWTWYSKTLLKICNEIGLYLLGVVAGDFLGVSITEDLFELLAFLRDTTSA